MTHSLLGIAIISVKDGGDISLDELREVIDMSETDLKPNDITERLNELGRYILNEPELRDYFKRVKLRNDGSPEFESIRSSYKRRIMFDKSGLGVDTAYAELNEMFGEGS